MELLNKYGLTQYFSELIIAKRGFERKPNPATIYHLINEHNMDQTETIMIGDRDLDLLSGKNAGLGTYRYYEYSWSHRCTYRFRNKESFKKRRRLNR
ncbi:HAD-IA family hydrolase [Halobacillus sp. ACCC02827]|uniref:HAD-IA family hydrolase n=1 Tax=Halobacillus sp. ACCC02827 TaxID=3052090 RepID=UPI003364F706